MEVIAALMVIAIIVTVAFNGDETLWKGFENASLMEKAAFVGHGALDDATHQVGLGVVQPATEFLSENLWVKVSTSNFSNGLWVVNAAVYKENTDDQPMFVFQTLQASKK